MNTITPSVILLLLLLCALHILRAENQFENNQDSYFLTNNNYAEDERRKRSGFDAFEAKAKPEDCEAIRDIRAQYCLVPVVHNTTEVVEYKKRQKRFLDAIAGAVGKAGTWVKNKSWKALKGVSKAVKTVVNPTAWSNAWRQFKLRIQGGLKKVFPDMPDFVRPQTPYDIGYQIKKPVVTCEEIVKLHDETLRCRNL